MQKIQNSVHVDNEGIKSEVAVTSQLKGVESVIFSCIVHKVNKLFLDDLRIIMVTNKGVYNIKNRTEI